MIFNKLIQAGVVSIIVLISGNIFANKPVVGIGEITSSVGGNPTSFQTMLETAISQTNKFELMERNRLDEVLSEQGLQGEFSDAGTVMKVGAVDYLVYGSITKFGTKKKEISTKKFATVKVIAEFGIDLKVVDATTGEIRRAETIDVSLETEIGRAHV